MTPERRHLYGRRRGRQRVGQAPPLPDGPAPVRGRGAHRRPARPQRRLCAGTRGPAGRPGPPREFAAALRHARHPRRGTTNAGPGPKRGTNPGAPSGSATTSSSAPSRSPSALPTAEHRDHRRRPPRRRPRSSSASPSRRRRRAPARSCRRSRTTRRRSRDSHPRLRPRRGTPTGSSALRSSASPRETSPWTASGRQLLQELRPREGRGPRPEGGLARVGAAGDGRRDGGFGVGEDHAHQPPGRASTSPTRAGTGSTATRPRGSPSARALLRNQKIGFVFQNFNLLPRLSALENVMMPLIDLRGLSERECRACGGAATQTSGPRRLQHESAHLRVASTASQPLVDLAPSPTTRAAPIGLAVVLIGFFVLVTRRRALSQLVGFLLMDNGITAVAFLTTAGIGLVVEARRRPRRAAGGAGAAGAHLPDAGRVRRHRPRRAAGAARLMAPGSRTSPCCTRCWPPPCTPSLGLAASHGVGRHPHRGRRAGRRDPAGPGRDRLPGRSPGRSAARSTRSVRSCWS